MGGAVDAKQARVGGIGQDPALIVAGCVHNVVAEDVGVGDDRRRGPQERVGEAAMDRRVPDRLPGVLDVDVAWAPCEPPTISTALTDEPNPRTVTYRCAMGSRTQIAACNQVSCGSFLAKNRMTAGSDDQHAPEPAIRRRRAPQNARRRGRKRCPRDKWLFALEWGEAARKGAGSCPAHTSVPFLCRSFGWSGHV